MENSEGNTRDIAQRTSGRARTCNVKYLVIEVGAACTLNMNARGEKEQRIVSVGLHAYYNTNQMQTK